MIYSFRRRLTTLSVILIYYMYVYLVALHTHKHHTQTHSHEHGILKCILQSTLCTYIHALAESLKARRKEVARAHSVRFYNSLFLSRSALAAEK